MDQTRYDVAVIGGGIMGSSVAYFLRHSIRRLRYA